MQRLAATVLIFIFACGIGFRFMRHSDQSPRDPANGYMNFHYEIFPEKKGVLMTMEGYFSLQDLMNSIERFWNDPQYDRDFNGLIDLTSPSLGVSLDDIRTLFHFIQEDKRTSRANWAVVASTPLAFACAMFYSKLMEKRHVLEVFSTWDAACTFIGMDFPHKNLPPPIRSDLV